MKLARVQLFAYELPLIQPIVAKGEMLAGRRGLVVKLATDTGLVGWGEIAPLPGFSRESLNLAQEESLKLKNNLTDSHLPDNFTPSAGQEDFWTACGGLSPSVRCGFELALWNLHAAAEPRKRVSLNGLVTGSGKEALRSAAGMVRAGYKAVKLKVGSKNLEADIDLTRKVRAAVGAQVRLRLDANRAWNLKDAVRFGKAVSACNPEYIEEPTADPKELETFFSDCGLPIALDETLLDSPLETLERTRGLKAVILKPTLLGGFHRAFRLAQQAQRHGIQPVVSSCFESGIGILGLARFAAFLSLEDVAAGLDTYRWLKQDLLVPPLRIARGEIESIPPTEWTLTVNTALLREIGDG